MKLNREAALFAMALDRPMEERAAFLDVVCEGEPALRLRLESLLAAHEQLPAEPGDDALLTARADAEISSSDEAVGQILGRYKLLEKIGEGGCGMVYVAEQIEPVRRRVALKVIKLGMDTKAVVARFEAERQALAMMDHPNIAKVLDAGTTEQGRPYFVMELVRGIKITDYCDQQKISTRERLVLFIKVCHAIQHAHQKGIIHRDIKPSNILVTLHDGVPVPKVIDFGIAKATEGRLTAATVYTQLHQFIGTPAYMSPEQAEMSGLDIDTRSDIYSLGVLLYELLTGRTPFDGKELISMGIDAMRRTIREKEPARPSTKVATLQGEELTTTANRRAVETAKLANLLRGDLDCTVMKCLEKDRTRRYETANALAMDLERHLNYEPVVARPPSAAYKLQKAWKRNRLAFAAGAAVAAVLIVGLGVSLWQYAGKSRAEREQVRLRIKAEAEALDASKARALAAQQRDLANQRLYDSLLREVRSIRKARPVGYRREVYDRIKQAAALGVSRKNLSLLRRDAALSFGDWVGLEPVDLSMSAGAGYGCVTSDGTLAAIFDLETGSIVLVAAGNGREVARLKVGGKLVLSLAFDPRGVALFASMLDDPRVAGVRPKSVRLEKWSLRGDGSWKRDWSRSTHRYSIVVATDEGPVALELGDKDAFISLVDLERDVEWQRVPLENPSPPFPGLLAVSADRKRLAYFSEQSTNSLDLQVELRDLTTGRIWKSVVREREGRRISFSGDGQLLVATFSGKAIVFDAADLSPVSRFQGTYDETFGAVLGEASGLLAVPAVQELGVRLIQPQSVRELAFINLPSSPEALCFSRDGSTLLVSHTRGARIIHLRADREKLLLDGHREGVPAMQFLPDGRHLVSVGKDRTLRLWDLDSGHSQILTRLTATGQTLALSPDGSWLACGYYDITDLSLWSFEESKQLGQVTLSEQGGPRFGTTWNCALSPDARLLAAAGKDLRVWEIGRSVRHQGDGSTSYSLRFSETNAFSGVAFDPSGKRLAYQSFTTDAAHVPVLKIRSLEAGARPEIIATNIVQNPVQSLCFMPKSGRLAYVTRFRREIVMLEPETWKPLSKLSTLAPEGQSAWYVANLSVNRDESRLAVVTPSGLGVDLRDTVTGELLYTLPEEPGTVWWLAWSPDSRQLAVSRANGEIAIWNLTEVEAQLEQLGLKP